MTLALLLSDLCRLLREGGQLAPEAWPPLEAELLARTRSLEEQLRAETEATGVPAFQELVEEAASDYREALGALKLAFAEDAPELAGWIQERLQNADETLRRVRQMLVEFSTMLSEEDAHGNL